uniref:Uncharacterized protein n=1 Tax=Romanomermis culicivorax TaxID=13658 RepID=A0A915IB93_ROMCU
MLLEEPSKRPSPQLFTLVSCVFKKHDNVEGFPAWFRARGLAETSILHVECCMLPKSIPAPWSNREPLVWSPVLKGFLHGAGAYPPLANVGVGVTILTRAQQKKPGSGLVD